MKTTTHLYCQSKKSKLEPVESVDQEIYDSNYYSKSKTTHTWKVEMPLLGYKWYEERNCDPKSTPSFCPHLSKNQVKSEFILSMPLVSKGFYENVCSSKSHKESTQGTTSAKNYLTHAQVEEHKKNIKRRGSRDANKVIYVERETQEYCSSSNSAEKVEFKSSFPLLTQKWFNRRGHLMNNSSNNNNSNNSNNNRGKFIINDGPIVSTQQAGKVYFRKKTNFLAYSSEEK